MTLNEQSNPMTEANKSISYGGMGKKIRGVLAIIVGAVVGVYLLPFIHALFARCTLAVPRHMFITAMWVTELLASSITGLIIGFPVGCFAPRRGWLYAIYTTSLVVIFYLVYETVGPFQVWSGTWLDALLLSNHVCFIGGGSLGAYFGGRLLKRRNSEAA